MTAPNGDSVVTSPAPEVPTRADVERVIDALDKHRTRSIDFHPGAGDEAIWSCQIGGVFPHGALPPTADNPMRQAVQEAYREITGMDDGYIFSGWGGELDEAHRAVVEHREPVYERTDWALFRAAADLIEALWAEVEAHRG